MILSFPTCYGVLLSNVLLPGIALQGGWWSMKIAEKSVLSWNGSTGLIFRTKRTPNIVGAVRCKRCRVHRPTLLLSTVMWEIAYSAFFLTIFWQLVIILIQCLYVVNCNVNIQTNRLPFLCYRSSAGSPGHNCNSVLRLRCAPLPNSIAATSRKPVVSCRTSFRRSNSTSATRHARHAVFKNYRVVHNNRRVKSRQWSFV